MSSCVDTPTARVMLQNPIYPVHVTGDRQEVYWTDYVPLLVAEGMLPETGVIEASNEITNIRFMEQRACVDIVALPNKPVAHHLVSAGVSDGKVYVRLTEPGENVKVYAYVQNYRLDGAVITQVEGEEYIVDLSVMPARMKRLETAYLRVYAEDESHLFNDLMIPLRKGKVIMDATQVNRHMPQGQVLYSLMVDRFENGNTENDWKMNSPEVLDIVDYQGGDFAGITQKIEEGFFDDLGINTIWVSPITQNPWTAWGCYEFKNGNKYDASKKYTRFSGYHGYWPIYSTKVEQRFGTDKELHTMLETAHKHGINVILDYVANHLHIESPVYQEHPDWHTDSILPDGRRNFELWDEARLTTWFDKHIPTLDLERAEVCDPMTDSALYWLENFEFDGFRHDACKHIPEGYWRLFGQKLATRFPNRAVWMIGETYGSPELINMYVKTGLLNAQFDFNVYFTLVNALCCHGNTMKDVNRTILTSLDTYGSHHTMGNISGNHDQKRFASLAGGAISFDGQGKEEGWTREVGIGNAEIAYKRALLLEVINMTIPGVPCIYQGDEYGEVGGNDPDNRHMMRFDEKLNEAEAAFKAEVKELIALRRHSMPLLYGDYIPRYADDDILEYDRVYMGETIRVRVDRKNLTYNISTIEE